VRLLLTFGRRYPWRSLLTVGALLLAGLADGLGLTTLLTMLATLASGTQGGALPGPGRELLERLQAMGITPSVEVLLGIVLGATLLKAALTMLANSQVGWTVARVATDLRLQLMRALFATRWEYYVHKPVGAIAHAFSGEANRAATAYLQAVTALALFIQACVYTALAFAVSWIASVAALGVGLLVTVALGSLVRVARRAGRQQRRIGRRLLAYFTDSLLSVKALKAMGREEHADRALARQTRQLHKAIRLQVLSKEALPAVQEPVMAALASVAIYLALVRWHMPLASVMVVVFLLARVVNYLNKVQRAYQQMAASEDAYWSLSRTIEEAREQAEPDLGRTPPTLERGIELRDVRFAYGERAVLDGLTLAIPAHALTTVVGPSGSGKTTLVDLIIGLLRPQRGEIYVDGVPMAQLDRRAWRRAIGYVPQDTALMHDTVLANITLGESGITEADAQRALREAGAWEFVAALPEGIHSVVGERGGRLSGGQRQRIAIARALAHRPMLLILDEATSALDAATEAAICETLLALRGELTLLAISHRPGLIRYADQVCRLEQVATTPPPAASVYPA
jgi:ATP-binding cassette, subfamily C, bacterial